MRPRTSLSVSAAVVARPMPISMFSSSSPSRTGGFGDLGAAASGELGYALDSFATLLLSAGVVAVLGGRRAADARTLAHRLHCSTYGSAAVGRNSSPRVYRTARALATTPGQSQRKPGKQARPWSRQELHPATHLRRTSTAPLSAARALARIATMRSRTFLPGRLTLVPSRRR
jgi:hypothetical protein